MGKAKYEYIISRDISDEKHFVVIPKIRIPKVSTQYIMTDEAIADSTYVISDIKRIYPELSEYFAAIKLHTTHKKLVSIIDINFDK